MDPRVADARRRGCDRLAARTPSETSSSPPHDIEERSPTYEDQRRDGSRSDIASRSDKSSREELSVSSLSSSDSLMKASDQTTKLNTSAVLERYRDEFNLADTAVKQDRASTGPPDEVDEWFTAHSDDLLRLSSVERNNRELLPALDAPRITMTREETLSTHSQDESETSWHASATRHSFLHGQEMLPLQSSGVRGSSFTASDVVKEPRRYFAPILVPDDDAPGCQQCGVRFSTFRRRRHCRLCGNVYCAECTANKAKLPFEAPASEKEQPVCMRCVRNIHADDFVSIVGLRRKLDDPLSTIEDKVEQLSQLSMTLAGGRPETDENMGLHRVAQLNDIEAAGGVACFCQLLTTDVKVLQQATLYMLVNLMKLENSAGNEFSAGEAFVHSGACAKVIKILKNREIAQQVDLERVALRLVYQMCHSIPCQNALCKAGAGSRLMDLMSVDSPSTLEIRVEAARCLKRFVHKNAKNIVVMIQSKGVAALCMLLGDFIELRTDISLDKSKSGVSRDESLGVAMEAILSTISECINFADFGASQTQRGVQQIPADGIHSFVTVLKTSGHANRMLASQVLIQVSKEQSLILLLAKEETFVKEIMWMLDNGDSTIASEILCGLCSTVSNQNLNGSFRGGKSNHAHEQVLKLLYELQVFDLVLKKLNACVVGDQQLVGEITLQRNLLSITKSYSAKSATYADHICARNCVPTLCAFLLSHKERLIPVCAQTLMNLCSFNSSIFDELYNYNVSDFFHRLLLTPPEENQLSALQYFQSLVDTKRPFSVDVLDTLFRMASGRDKFLKAKSLEILARLSSVDSIFSELEPLEDSLTPKTGDLVQELQERVVAMAYFPVLIASACSSAESEVRSNAIKCLSCGVNGDKELVGRMLEEEMLRAFYTGLRRWMNVPATELTLIEMRLNKALLQLLYLVLKKTSSRIALMGEEQVTNLMTVVTEFIVSQPGCLVPAIRIIRLLMSHAFWKASFIKLYALESMSTGLKFVRALINGIAQSSLEVKEDSENMVLDEGVAVLKELMKDIQKPDQNDVVEENDAIINLFISAGAHISLLELLRDSAVREISRNRQGQANFEMDEYAFEASHEYVATRALELLGLLARSRRIRLLILEAGAALDALVIAYEAATSEYTNSSPVRQLIAQDLGRILIHLSSDPLEFRKTLYDHRAVLPRTILENILSPAAEVAETAEKIVLNLVESDFATCPLWLELIETANVRLLFGVVLGAKRLSVKVTAARKLFDIVFSHTDILDEDNGLSLEEMSTLVSMLIDFFIDVNPRTSVVGVLALTLLLKNGRTLDKHQMERIALDGAVSLVYWMEKGTERQQENAVKILHDGVTDSAILLKFYEQIQDMSVQRESAFLLELGQQLLDVDLTTNPDGLLKRCKLLEGLLHVTDLSALPIDCIEIIEEVTAYLLELVKDKEHEFENAIKNADEKKCWETLLLAIVNFLDALAPSSTFHSTLVQQNTIEKLLSVLNGQKTATEPCAELIDRICRVLRKLCMHEVPRLVACNGTEVLLETVMSHKVGERGVEHVAEMLETFNLIVDCGQSGKSALMETEGFFESLVRGFKTVSGDFSEDQTGMNAIFFSTESDEPKANLEVACGLCALIFFLARGRTYRPQLYKNAYLVRHIVAVMAWFPSIFTRKETVTPELKEKFRLIIGSGLPFLEAAIVSAEELGLQLIDMNNLFKKAFSVYMKTIDTYADGHQCVDLFLAACDGLKSFLCSDRGLTMLNQQDKCELELQVLHALKSSLNSIECRLALLEIAAIATQFAEPNDVESARSAWLVDRVLHALFQFESFADDLDVSILYTLLLQFSSSCRIRTLLFEHDEYDKLVRILVAIAIDGEWQRWRKKTVRVLQLLGEDSALEQVHIDVERLPMLQASTMSLYRNRDSKQVTNPIRCYHCRQMVSAPVQANQSSVPCPYCQKTIVLSSDNFLSATDDELPSVVEQLDTNDGENSALCRLSMEGEDFVCINCNRMLELPLGLSTAEFICPHCLQLASVKKTSLSVLPALTTKKERLSVSSVRSVESGASLPVDSSLSGIDVRDTKVVSCGHCDKHLIVKNGAPAVKCPSCRGVSKLSTTTTQEMMRCRNCNTLLSLPAGARAYKCMKCLQTTRLS